jgi:hypothetical protein
MYLSILWGVVKEPKGERREKKGVPSDFTPRLKARKFFNNYFGEKVGTKREKV